MTLDMTVHSLEIDCLKTLPASELRQLALVFQTYVPGLAHNLCVTLPRRLQEFRHLDLAHSEFEITDKSLENLPSALKRFAAGSAPGIKGYCKDKLPKTLATLTLGSKEPPWRKSG